MKAMGIPNLYDTPIQIMIQKINSTSSPSRSAVGSARGTPSPSRSSIRNSESLEIEYSSCSSRRLSRCYASTMGVPMCEVCEKTGASYGVATGAKRRWCATCGKEKGGVRVDPASRPGLRFGLPDHLTTPGPANGPANLRRSGKWSRAPCCQHKSQP